MKISLELTVAQVDQMRHLIDNLPMGRYAPLILAVLKGLPLISKIDGRDMVFENGQFIPLESDAAQPPCGADGATQTSRECLDLGGFSLRALTPKGERLMPEIARIMGQLEIES